MYICGAASNMIAWKADAGFSGTQRIQEGSNISDLTFLDFDQPYSIATTVNEVVSAEQGYSLDYSDRYGWGVQSNTEFLINFFYDIFGEDASTLYCAPAQWRTISATGYDFFINAVPSIFNSFKNTYDALRAAIEVDQATNYNTYIHLKSLKRLLYYRNNALNGILTVSDTGTLNYILTGERFAPPLYFNMASQFGVSVFAIKGCDGTLESILDANNYYWAFIGDIGTTNKYALYKANGNENAKRWVSYLFTEQNYVPPDYVVNPPPPDPYAPGGETEPGGGEGDFDDTSVPIDFPPMPKLSAVDTGFVTLFNPTEAQLKNLSSYMWSDLFDVEGWKKIFANPMDAILGLTIVPVAVPNAGTGVVTVGNISTGISMNKASGQYVEVDCGTLNVNEYWGAYLDYDPYTKAEIYLPFIGIHALSTDDIMKKPVHVKYRIDLLSGACCAYVKCGDSVLYSFVGQCSCSIPVTSSDWTNIINGALSIAGAIGSMVATGGASAPMAAGTIASAAVNALKPTIEKSGSMGGMGGMLGVQEPYLILTRPRQALPPSLNTYSGYPSFMTKTLGDLSGFTVVDSIHLENIPATGAELSEIESLLKEGVIL